MASTTFRLDIGNNHWLNLIIDETAQDTTLNKTTISYTVVFHTGNNYYHYTYNNELWLTINGTAIYNDADVGSIQLDNNQSKILGSGSLTITHDSDGSKTISIYMRFRQAGGGSSTYDANATYSLTLTRINRGIVSIYDGSSFSEYQCYIHDGTSWVMYQPYIYADGSWQMY